MISSTMMKAAERAPTLLGRGQPLYLSVYIGLIVFFTFFYTTIVFNPADTADNLKKHGGFIPASGRAETPRSI